MSLWSDSQAADPFLARGHQRLLLVLAAATAGLAGALEPSRPLVAASVVIASCCTWLVVSAPAIGVVGLALLTPILSGLRTGLPVQGLRVSEVLISWIGLLVILVSRRPVPRWGRLEYVGLAYAVGTLILGILDLDRRGSGFHGLGTLVGPFQYLILYRAVRLGCRDERTVRYVLRALIAGGVPVSILALLQGFGVSWAQHFAFRLTGLDEGHLNRAIGPFSNWQVLAGYLFVIALLVTSCMVEQNRPTISPRLGSLILILVLAALARTLTIGAFAGAVLGCWMLFRGAGRLKIGRTARTVATALAMIVLGAVVASRFAQQFSGQSGLVPATIAARIHNWTQQYLPALANRWVTGYGPGVPPDATWRYTDSVYITILLRGGLLLLGIYLMLMYVFFDQATSACRQASLAVAGNTLKVAIVELLVLQIIATYFTTSGLPEVVWILAGLTSVELTTPHSRRQRECPRNCVGTNERDVHAFNPR